MKKNKEKGFVMYLIFVFIAIVLALIIPMSFISYKKLYLTDIAESSQRAFYAAEGAMDCALLSYKEKGSDGMGIKDLVEERCNLIGHVTVDPLEGFGEVEFEIYLGEEGGSSRPCAKVLMKNNNGNLEIISRGYDDCARKGAERAIFFSDSEGLYFEER